MKSKNVGDHTKAFTGGSTIAVYRYVDTVPVFRLPIEQSVTKVESEIGLVLRVDGRVRLPWRDSRQKLRVR